MPKKHKTINIRIRQLKAIEFLGNGAGSLYMLLSNNPPAHPPWGSHLNWFLSANLLKILSNNKTIYQSYSDAATTVQRICKKEDLFGKIFYWTNYCPSYALKVWLALMHTP